jgi:hypothetical protein
MTSGMVLADFETDYTQQGLCLFVGAYIGSAFRFAIFLGDRFRA